ncbi:hypothetical protein M422DRAFT_255034 [Sphaerobolus stellatus SS14]|uniref:Glutathione transferase n=1 Tax=Sphaerobolus stellatus (strain SS14) TaxID=990650 RepID=A0A0C9UG56_SPHS4|nr:hypothetical protein M422DRAFT_255034 [Sphaerobolus stellatus SS14]
MAPKVTLFTDSNGQTPNPRKIAILLEELGIEHALIVKDFGGTDPKHGMKGEEYFKFTPNGRVPCLIDHTNNDFTVWESGAILLYVAERFDPSGRLRGETIQERTEVLKWLMFQISALGPMQGQVFWYKNLHPVKNLDQSVYDRYTNEVYRIYGVFEKQLEKHDWIALDRFTVADIANYTWLITYDQAGLSLTNFPKLAAYIERIRALPCATAGIEKHAAAAVAEAAKRSY